MTQFPKAIMATIAILVVVVTASEHSDRFPDMPVLNSLLGKGIAALVAGTLFGWFLPRGARGLLAGGAGIVLVGMVLAGTWAGVVILMVIVSAPAIGVFFGGWFIGRTLVTRAGLGDNPINDRIGLGLFAIVVLSPLAWLVWEARHTVRGEFVDVRQRQDLWIDTPPPWRVRLGSRADGGPVATAGRVFATAERVLYGINSDGSGAWMTPNATTQPLWHNGRLYVGLTSGLARLDPETGLPIWTAAIPTAGISRYAGENRRRLSVGASGTIYVNPERDTIYAVNADGTVRWAFRHNAGHFAGAPVETLNGRVYVAALRSSRRGTVCAIDASGRLEWERPLPTSVVGPVGAAPDGTIYATGREYLFAIGPDGVERWRRGFGQWVSTPLFDPSGRVLVRSDAWYVMSHEGRPLHRVGAGGHPVFAGDFMLVPGTSVMAFNTTGELAFRIDIGEEPAFSLNEAAVGPDGMLYVQLEDSLVGLPLPRPPYRFRSRRM